MLQQTQVERVIEKYQEFLAAFPDFPALAKASLFKLLNVWSGMGYNRRALALKALAQKVVDEHRGKLPSDSDKLVALPGIGKYTAGAIMAFAFNKSVVFMDTNIRRVYIHEFFHGRENIHDDELIPLVEQTMDREHSRKWYNTYGLRDHAQEGVRESQQKERALCTPEPFEKFEPSGSRRILKVLVKESSPARRGL
jgi:A/G-specific adenine glycosylase